MNLKGSYKSLRNNSKAAILAAIEIYNKPQIKYRDECFTILLVNAWELLLKAILSKNNQHIYYEKKRSEPYRTLSIQDALLQAKFFFPSHISYEPVAQNINMLVTYRNNAIHFYNQVGFGVIIYGLAQTSIINFKDLMHSVFKFDISNEMAISLLPLSFGTRPDPIQFLHQAKTDTPKNKAVAQFIKEISQVTRQLETQYLDTSRFLTVFTVTLQSVKKLSSADVVVAVKSGQDDGAEPLIIERSVDPNISHPLSSKDVLEKVGTAVSGIKFTSYTLQAVIWKKEIKFKPYLCWQSTRKELTRYSLEVPSIIKKLTKDEIELALHDYKQYLHRVRYHK